MKLLDLVACALGALIAAMLVTGGTVMHLPVGRVEFSSLDPWVLGLVAILYARSRLNPLTNSPVLALLKRLAQYFTDPSRGTRRTVLLFSGLVAALVLAHCLKHWSLHTNYYDQGCVNPALLNAWGSAGRPLLVCAECPGGSYLGVHLAYVFFPLSFLLRGPFAADEWIFALQGLLPWAAVLLALRASELGSRRSLWFYALVPLMCSRAFRAGLVWDFREDVPAFCFLLLAGVAIQRSRWLLYFASIGLAMLCKENVALVCLMFSLPILFDRDLLLSNKQRLVLAGATAVLSGAYTWLAFGVLLPHYSPAISQSSEIVRRLGEYGSTPAEVLSHILFSPSAWWSILKTRFLTFDRLKYLLLLIAPFAFFFRRRSLPWILPAIAGISMNLVSSTPVQRSLQFHYDWIILPFLCLGAWRGVTTFQQAPSAGRSSLKPAYLLLAALLFSGRWPGWEISRNFPSASDLAARRELATLADTLPPETEIAMNETLVPQLIGDGTRLRVRLHHLDPEARALVLDLSLAEESSLRDQLLKRDWTVLATSGRYLFIHAPTP